LHLYEEALSIEHKVGHRIGEATTLASMAKVLYQFLNRPKDAIKQLEQAIILLIEAGLPRDGFGRTVEDLQEILENMLRGNRIEVIVGKPTTTLPAQQIQLIITNTISVMTTRQDRRAEWREVIRASLQEIQQEGTSRQFDIDFLISILA